MTWPLQASRPDLLDAQTTGASHAPPMLAITESWAIVESGFQAEITGYIKWPDPLVCGLEPPPRGNLWNHILETTAKAGFRRKWFWQRWWDGWWA